MPRQYTSAPTLRCRKCKAVKPRDAFDDEFDRQGLKHGKVDHCQDCRAAAAYRRTHINCLRCKRDLPREAFDPSYRKDGRPGGLQLRCRECQHRALPTITDRLMAGGRRDERGCLLWQGTIVSTGYGRISIGHRPHDVHRLIWELHHGPIPVGMHICHKCDVRNCFEISHLFLGTQADNMRDAVNKGRMMAGERHYRAKVTADDVRAIRAAEGPGAATRMAHQYGLSVGSVKRIRSRRSWASVA